MYTEIIKLINDTNITLLAAFFNKIYDSGKIPTDWLKSVFISTPKKKRTAQRNAKTTD